MIALVLLMAGAFWLAVVALFGWPAAGMVAGACVTVAIVANDEWLAWRQRRLGVARLRISRSNDALNRILGRRRG